MSINYVKAQETDAEVQALAKATKESTKTICGMINQDRYRKEYNRQKQQQMKVLRKLVKEHPELVAAVEKEVKS